MVCGSSGFCVLALCAFDLVSALSLPRERDRVLREHAADSQHDGGSNTKHPEVVGKHRSIERSSPGADIRSEGKRSPAELVVDPPCVEIGRALSQSNYWGDAWQPDITLAKACRESLDLRDADARQTLDAVRRHVAFHTVDRYPPNPVLGNQPIDLASGLDAIDAKLADSQYKKQADFDEDLYRLFAAANDSHLGMHSVWLTGQLKYIRSVKAALTCISVNNQPSEVFLQDDVQEGRFNAILQINDVDVAQFLEEASSLLQYSDADTRWNALFVPPMGVGADVDIYDANLGYFVYPDSYPQPTTKITFKDPNIKPLEIDNEAWVMNPLLWEGLRDNDEVYDKLIKQFVVKDPYAAIPSGGHPTNATFLQRRAMSFLKSRNSKKALEKRDDGAVMRLRMHNSRFMEGHFIKEIGGVGDIAVLVLQTFDLASSSDASRAEFDEKLYSFFDTCKSAGITRLVIDLQSNDGGSLLTGLLVYNQMFPGEVPATLYRMRAHPAVNIMGSALSQIAPYLSEQEQFRTPWDIKSYVDSAGQPFRSWVQMYSPKLLGDQWFSSNFRTAGMREKVKTMPGPLFTGDDVVVLTNGVCVSMCAMLVTALRERINVKTVVQGGRPTNLGPITHLGGTKGARVETSLELVNAARYVDDLVPLSQREEAAKVLPIAPAIPLALAIVNGFDAINPKDPNTPLQNVYEPADCRLRLTAEMHLDVTVLWRTVAQAAFGGNSALDGARRGWNFNLCMSTTSEAAGVA